LAESSRCKLTGACNKDCCTRQLVAEFTFAAMTHSANCAVPGLAKQKTAGALVSAEHSTSSMIPGCAKSKESSPSDTP
jgi:hypothetical protein